MDVVSFEDVDLTDEKEQLDQVSLQLAVLESYHQEISDIGGVSRDQARALVRECGMSMGERYPLNSFTVLPSKTNFSVAMENMEETTASLVWELVKKAARLFLKLLAWVIDLIKNRRTANAAAAKTVERIDLVNRATAELKAAGSNEVNVPASNETEVSRARQTIDETEERYQEAFNDLVADMLTDGQFLRYVQSLDIHMLYVAGIFRNKQALFHTAMQSNRQDPGGVVVQISELRTVAMEVVPGDLGRQAARGGVNVPPNATLSDIMRASIDHARVLLARREFETPDYMRVAHVAAEDINQVLSPLPAAPDETRRIIDDLVRQTRAITAAQPPSNNSPELRKAFLQAQQQVNKEVQMLQNFWQLLLLVGQARDRLFHATYARGMAELQLSKVLTSVSQDETLMQQGMRVLTNLNNALRRV